MYSPKRLSRYFTIGLFGCSIVALSSGCVATRKFTRNEVHTTADQLDAKLSGRIDKTDSNLKETNDHVSTLDTRTNEQGKQIVSLNGDLQKTSERTTQAQGAAQNAQSTADQAQGRVVTLEENFHNRNQYTVADEKFVMFPFGSATLDKKFNSMLDELAQMLSQNPDALIVLEGRTDSTGDATYNIQLGERRAAAVKRYLVVDKSVPLYRIHEMSFGAARPIAENDSKEGREKNRVVAISVLTPRSGTKSASNPTK